MKIQLHKTEKFSKSVELKIKGVYFQHDNCIMIAPRVVSIHMNIDIDISGTYWHNTMKTFSYEQLQNAKSPPYDFKYLKQIFLWQPMLIKYSWVIFRP